MQALPKIQVPQGDLTHLRLFFCLIPKGREKKKSEFSPELSFTVLHDISPSFHRGKNEPQLPPAWTVRGAVCVHCPPSSHATHPTE